MNGQTAIPGLRVWLIYEDCAFHPVLCTDLDLDGDEIKGISLIDGSAPRACSVRHCGPVPLTIAQAVWIKAHFDTYVAARAAGREPHSVID